MTTYNNTAMYTCLPTVQLKLYDDEGNHTGFRLSASYRNDNTGQIAIKSISVSVTTEQIQAFVNDISLFEDFLEAKSLEHNLIHHCNVALTPESGE